MLVPFVYHLLFLIVMNLLQAIVADIWNGKVINSGSSYNAYRKAKSSENSGGK